MDAISIQSLQKQALKLKALALTMIYEAQSGHPGGAFSMADIITALYYKEMRINPKDPKWPDRDRFILSKGHACPIQYAALGDLGYFDQKHFHTLRREGSILQGHPDMKKCPGIDISTGSLGQGLSCGVGMALAGKRDHKDYRVFVAVGDGELDEGEIWEAIMSAYAFKLNNLIIIVDLNGLQLDGTTDEIIPQLDVAQKMKAFGLETYEIDGHNMEEILEILDKIRASDLEVPKCICAHTVKGKGVSFMENRLGWHGKAPNEDEFKQAMSQLTEANL